MMNQLRILGQIVTPRFSGGEYHAMVHTDDPRKLDWNDIPAKLVWGGKKLHVCVRTPERAHHAFSSEELKELGQQLVHDEENPVAAELRDVEEGVAFYRQRFQEDLQKFERGEMVLLQFLWNGAKSSWQAERWDGDTKIVYVASHRTTKYAEGGRHMACVPEKTTVNHPATKERKGFKLVIVAVSHEHFNPDIRIRALRESLRMGSK